MDRSTQEYKNEPQKQTQKVVEKQKLERYGGDRVETCTEEETSTRGKFRANWEKGAHATIHQGERWGDVK